MDATAWQQLVEAAGGERNVAAYCAEQLAQTAGKKQGNAEKATKAEKAESSEKAENKVKQAKKAEKEAKAAKP